MIIQIIENKYPALIENVNDDGKLASQRAIIDENHAPNLNETRERLQFPILGENEH